ncbi:hypothetical protein [Mycoplasma seminis]|uniref:Uncharacterized protein n=1 Tax=Mycoplasma seminis TaxID=512749 RepID=A0ABY9H9R4_9MOLU|nr:hypothetical protein [Mycoplasma seminis]WLP85327.1 hypothetical protein Q8852_03320 [Mycoplasma seminis]
MTQGVNINIKKPSNIDIYETVYAISWSKVIWHFVAWFSVVFLGGLYYYAEYSLQKTSAYYPVIIIGEVLDWILFFWAARVFGMQFNLVKHKGLDLNIDSSKFTMDSLMYLYFSTESWILERYIITFIRYKFGFSKYWLSIKYYLYRNMNENKN